ncbi:hypothetical protein AB0O28_19100 [Microbispora sp. NPDC088329]|uniref:hypothetical protein n=1 Tax=Microbispora sp. NPDC088329 TaxID=3154869 RepID=UPI00341434CD
MPDQFAAMREGLRLALQAAVPLEVMALAGATDEQRRTAAAGASRTIGEHGDQLMFGGRRAADAFAAVARGLAVLAYQPGGVTFHGLHFCTDHAACETAAQAVRQGARA